MQLRKLKYLRLMQADAQLTGIYKAANPWVLFIFPGSDWPYLQEWR